MRRRFRSLPGAAAAVGAFVLTVLLGLGGASASALWQQSATATMAVSAAAAWPGPAITSLTCTNDASESTATLHVTVPATASISYAALQSNGSLGPSYAGLSSLLALTPGSFILTSSTNPLLASPIIRDNPAGPLTVRVTATYVDQTTAHLDIVLHNSLSNGKITCPVSPVM
ncbi:hypothetical protein FDW83_15045 [Pseudarthrobacter sp. NamE2]|uniref:hypothetical protein n=1 Tax=Pseudarthrobacter sp. NamE2 TaxID=2576838 RepID=UPI0010FEA1C1|nr:hypothetical protein [Pseudarthrobacter sp. NamE2]TLM81731.1 hypothetical protein FDW83_15045 [Pseudarthrobacter sp. NamE2]